LQTLRSELAFHLEMARAPKLAKACPNCGNPMSEGSVRLQAKAGLRGARIDWMKQLSDGAEVDRDGWESDETLANYGARDVLVPGAYGLRFPAWRCRECRIVVFSYPQGNRRW